MKRVLLVLTLLVVVTSFAVGQLTEGEEALIKRLLPTLELLEDAIQKKVVFMFTLDQCPNGWEDYVTAQGSFLIGADGDEFVTGKTGGNREHAHTGTTGGGLGTVSVDDNGVHIPSARHTHRFQTDADPELPLPPYVAVRFCTPA